MYENLIAIVFVLGYAAMAIEHKIGINKASSALLTAVACWVLLAEKHIHVTGGHIHDIVDGLAHHMEGISQIVFFLIGAMTIVRLMEIHDGFQFVSEILTVKKKRTLLWVISLITFFLSAVLDNLTTAIVMVSLLRRFISDKQDRLVFCSMIIIAANAGGAWSPIGDVTTTMLWIGGQISAFKIIERLFIPSVISMIIPLIYFSWTMKDGDVLKMTDMNEKKLTGSRRIFFLGLGSLILVPIFKTMTGLPPFIGVLLGLGILWLATDLIHDESRDHLKVPRALNHIDMSSIMFFLAILLAVSALETAGLLTQLASWLDRTLYNKDIIAVALGLLSSIVDNVPLTAATMGMYDLAQFPMDSKLWELLAYCVGTGGSLLIIGSAAGVVVMGMEKINFLWYLRKVSLPALIGYGAGVAVYLFIYHIVG